MEIASIYLYNLKGFGIGFVCFGPYFKREAGSYIRPTHVEIGLHFEAHAQPRIIAKNSRVKDSVGETIFATPSLTRASIGNNQKSKRMNKTHISMVISFFIQIFTMSFDFMVDSITTAAWKHPMALSYMIQQRTAV